MIKANLDRQPAMNLKVKQKGWEKINTNRSKASSSPVLCWQEACRYASCFTDKMAILVVHIMYTKLHIHEQVSQRHFRKVRITSKRKDS
ncbi:hypothetical protein EAG_14990 [Camponotus floridanus]|uniref:Uncharacterized protein n=1 Tax=Camponotus floridanus TaxID=104421 RepID=E2ARP1_CAMFO|nr:hypothetical protein EAG_14990 [Camponotus floridanus]